MNANSRAAAAAAGIRHHLISRSRTGYAVKSLKEVKIYSKRFSAYPATGRESPDAKNSHHFYLTMHALKEEREIPIIDKVTFLAERMVHGTDAIPKIE